MSESISPTGARDDAGILTVAYDRDVPEEAQSLFDRAKPTADIRILTVVLDPNTEKEKVLSKTVRKGDLFGIVISDGYEMFSDEECTVPYVSDRNADSHVLIYSKKTCYSFRSAIRSERKPRKIIFGIFSRITYKITPQQVFYLLRRGF